MSLRAFVPLFIVHALPVQELALPANKDDVVEETQGAAGCVDNEGTASRHNAFVLHCDVIS